MSLNIKNEETCRLAAELARMTGQSMTGAITSALRERLAREKRLRGVEVRAQKLLAIGERCAQRLGPGPAAKDHGDVLYDERGLPG
jgi:antitoxin VapB